jgi:regulator of replication initiation timing
MNETQIIKFTEDEVNRIQELQQKVLTINTQVGEVELRINGLEVEFQELKKQKQSLISEYNTLSVEEQDIANDLKEKYGEGTYDISKNEFTPTK